MSTRKDVKDQVGTDRAREELKRAIHAITAAILEISSAGMIAKLDDALKVLQDAYRALPPRRDGDDQ